MAQDTVMFKKNRTKVLDCWENSYEKNGEKKEFFSIYVHEASIPEEGLEPRVLKIDVPHREAYIEAKKLVGHSCSFVAVKDSFGKFERYTYLCSIEEFLKAS